ncbi:hypothetical protein ACH492_00370 [Streptomyces sp. NPDC019443]|uniref:hypothetical protein n=1 Tax=Streptomyces sp. NPDC019443 TaxID=3365061 RepID=UPI0037A0AD2E
MCHSPLVHGRPDLGAPLTTAREPAKAWPDAELRVVGGNGHPEDNKMRAQILGALAFEDGHS